MTTKTTTTKTTAKRPVAAANVVDFPTFEVPAALRDFADQGVQQARTAYESYKTLAEDATDMIEDNFQTASKNATEMNKRFLAMAKDNMNASFELAEKMMGVKSVSEFFELQNDFARTRFEIATAHAKDIQEMATKAAEEATAPMKDGVAKAMGTFKAAV